MKRILAVCGTGLALAALTGCVAMQGEPERPVATQDDLNYLRAELTRQQQYIHSLEEQIGQLNGDVAQNRYQTASAMSGYASAAQLQALQGEVGALRQQVQALDQARAKDRQAIYDDITKKVTSLMKTAGGGGGGRPSGGTRTGPQTGIEHVVQPGESLSKIAAAYGVKMNVLVEVNGLSDPGNIRVGQKIFIPD
jgi:LysM repeat protein